MLRHTGGEVGCYPGVKGAVVGEAHDVDVAAHGVWFNFTHEN